MSDDILTRLRKCTCLHLELLTQTNWFPDGCIQCAAADEIERLRAELDACRERNAWVERHD
jgi:hypothetical protein